ncbi:hypothetical protein NGM10_16290 (plasmid) [Halorussus salilacus]|uniref:hypothetical protein n=1 Tax=Halorussus salilacus TaxID=2953750 RepID=UPI00209FF359|nr:hypothetical protein [Halorussus salilacus]USZ69962.1 hypothetical protein NGM10_16290 [Halorussus salilacus]
MADPLDPFSGVEEEDARDLAARHQRLVREFSDLSVADVVYEYRTRFHRDPLVARDGAAYYLSVRSHVWEDFADRLETSEAELARLKAVHAEAFRAGVGDPDDHEGEPLVLVEED